MGKILKFQLPGSNQVGHVYVSRIFSGQVFFNPLYKGHPDFRPTWISSEMAIRIAPSFHLKSPIFFKIIPENKHVKTISIFKDVFYVNISFPLHR